MMMGRSKIAKKDQEHNMDGTGAGDGVELSPSISSPSSSSFVSHQQSYSITHMHLTASSFSSTLSSVINPLSFGSHNSSTSSSIYSSSSGYGSSMHDFDVADRTDSRAGHWRTAWRSMCLYCAVWSCECWYIMSLSNKYLMVGDSQCLSLRIGYG